MTTTDRPRRDSHVAHWRRALIAFVLLLPVAIVPEVALADLLHPGAGFFVPDYELIHLYPRLLLLAAVALLGWRFWRFRGAFALLLAAQLALLLLSALLSGDPDGPLFWLLGPQRRMDGVLYAALVTLLGAAVYRTERISRGSVLGGVRWALSIAGGVQGALLLLQRFGVDPVGPVTFGGTYGYPSGTLAHPGMAAAFLLPVVVLQAAFLADGGPRTGARPWRRAAFVALALLSALGLGVTGNRSSFFALLPAAVALALLFRTRRHAAAALALLLVVGSANYALPNDSAGGTRSYAQARTLEIRTGIWRLVLAHADRIPGFPLLGGGPDALRLLVLRHVPPEEYVALSARELGWPRDAAIEGIRLDRSLGPRLRDAAYEVDLRLPGQEEVVTERLPIILDKAHNALLDRTLTSGPGGALIFALLYLWPAWRALRARDPDAKALAAALLAVFVYYLAWFPVLQAEPVHVVLLALSWARPARARPDGPEEVAA